MRKFITTPTLDEIKDFNYYTGLVLGHVKEGDLMKWSVNNQYYKVLTIDDFGINVRSIGTIKETLIPVTVFKHSFKKVSDVYAINYFA